MLNIYNQLSLALSLQNELSISRDNYPRHFRCATDADASLPELIYVYKYVTFSKNWTQKKVWVGTKLQLNAIDTIVCI